MVNDIKNSVARIWTPTQLRETVKQAKATGYTVTKDEEMTTITHPNGDTILRALKLRTILVRLDSSYFEK